MSESFLLPNKGDAGRLNSLSGRHVYITGHGKCERDLNTVLRALSAVMYVGIAMKGVLKLFSLHKHTVLRFFFILELKARPSFGVCLRATLSTMILVVPFWIGPR